MKNPTYIWEATKAQGLNSPPPHHIEFLGAAWALGLDSPPPPSWEKSNISPRGLFRPEALGAPFLHEIWGGAEACGAVQAFDTG